MSKLKDWKVEIPTEDFTTFVAKPVAVEPGKRNFFETKDSASETGYSLITKVRMTFSGLPTKNRAIYLPDQMFKGTTTWTKPFNKPIQKHHNDFKDPIGRVLDAKYVDTSGQAAQVDARVLSAMAPFRDKKEKKQAQFESVQLFQDITDANSNYMGVGHIMGLWKISSPEDIKKVQDGRLLTVSTSFTPEGAYCSQCAREGELTDWRYHGCDHGRGDVVDGYEVLAIPYGFEYHECSFVNDPAAVHARVLEHGDDVEFADAYNKDAFGIPHDLIVDPVIVHNDKAFRLSDSVEVSIPTRLSGGSSSFSDQNSQKIKDNSNSESDSQRIDMNKFSELIKDSASNYEAIAKHLEEGFSRLTGDLLKELEDSVFIGPNRTFPVKDEAHAKAIRALLEEIEDSEAKADLLDMLTDAETALTKEEDSSKVEDKEEDQAQEETREEDSAEDSPEEPAPETVTVEKDAYAELTQTADRVSDLEASREMLKKKIASLKDEVKALEALNTSLLKEKKENLANQLVDAQIAKGFTVNDRNEKVKAFKKRSLESLKDSIEDLKENNGTARNPSGEQVDSPLNPEKDNNEKEPEQDSAVLNKYSAIIDRFFDLKYGPKGQVAADSYLKEQKRLGFLPANINP